jgi:hypothetical protein
MHTFVQDSYAIGTKSPRFRGDFYWFSFVLDAIEKDLPTNSVQIIFPDPLQLEDDEFRFIAQQFMIEGPQLKYRVMEWSFQEINLSAVDEICTNVLPIFHSHSFHRNCHHD